MRLEERINAKKNELNPTDQLIWKYIVNQRAAVQQMSIHQLAKACSVSSTTIVRFAQKLELDGFGELRAHLKMEEPVREAYHDDVMQDLSHFYTATWSRLLQRNYDDANRLMHHAKRIFAFASGYVQSNVLQELKRIFFYDDLLIYEISGRDEFRSILRTAREGDLFLFISLSGESRRAVEFAREIHLRDYPLISITKLHENTLASLSDVNLYITPAEFSIFDPEDGRSAYRSMMPFFLLVEIWYMKYRIYLHEQRAIVKDSLS